MSIHVASEIQVLHVFSRYTSLRIDQIKSANILPSMVLFPGGVVGPIAPYKVLHMFPQGYSVEAPQYHVVIRVVPGVTDRYIMEQIEMCTQ